jgi:serine/threonine-protein kinase
MSLAPGSRIGPYEVTGLLGAGGMGEVYKARDTKLSRAVAIKALQPSVAADPDRIARFEREAQLLASLHHPSIAGIYGLEQDARGSYLVLEFVDGRPLDVVLRDGGPLPPTDAVKIARQIADAIAAAHEKGIIHRDLKPGNVMMTADGHVKVLDFGLGKSLEDGRPAAGESAAANSPTITLGTTQAGLILGTAGYMSPEQAKGRPADRRSDVWSFGCILFELLAGSRAFEGEDITDTIAAIVRGEPNWKALPATTPAFLRTLIERCLVKDRTERLADMSVVRYVLNEPDSRGPSSTTTLTPATLAARAPKIWIAATALLAATAATFALLYLNRPSLSTTGGELARFTVVLPDGDEVTNTNIVPLAIAPNGSAFVYTGLRAGKTQLFLHDFSSGNTTPLEGTDEARSPFFSPNGRWIGFFAKSKMKKITVGGTAVADVADVRDPRGGAWGPDDMIYYAPTSTAGLWKVAASGGTAVQITKPDPAASEISHRNPLVLPGGKALLFMVWTGPGADEHRIEYLSLSDGHREVVLRNADGPLAIVRDRLVYSREDTILSAPWNPARPSLEGVDPTVLPFFGQHENEGVSAYAATADGMFVHLVGSPTRRLAKIVWVDRSGKSEPLPVPDRDYASAALSPDGTRAALHHRGPTEEIWIYDFRTKSLTPLTTTGGSSQAPVWTMDSKFVIYRGTRQGFRNIYRKAADGSGAEERLTTKADVVQTPISVSPDGKWVVITEGGSTAIGGNDLWRLALDGAHATEPIVATPAAEIAGVVSPNGRWLSFDSTATSRYEVWVKRFDEPASSAMKRISRDGANASRWSRDGRELFFLAPNGIMAVSVTGDVFGQPRLLVEGRFRPPANANTNYDVAADGRFILVQPVQPTQPATRVGIVVNAVR